MNKEAALICLPLEKARWWMMNYPSGKWATLLKLSKWMLTLLMRNIKDNSQIHAFICIKVRIFTNMKVISIYSFEGEFFYIYVKFVCIKSIFFFCRPLLWSFLPVHIWRLSISLYIYIYITIISNKHSLWGICLSFLF